MNRLWISLGIATCLLASGCQYTDKAGGTHTLGLAPLDHNVSIKPNDSIDSPTKQTTTAESIDHPECSGLIALNNWAIIHGDEVGSKVNVRPEPSINSFDGRFGTVGTSVKIVGDMQDNFYRVRFSSGNEGWMHCSVLNDPKI